MSPLQSRFGLATILSHLRVCVAALDRSRGGRYLMVRRNAGEGRLPQLFHGLEREIHDRRAVMFRECFGATIPPVSTLLLEGSGGDVVDMDAHPGAMRPAGSWRRGRGGLRRSLNLFRTGLLTRDVKRFEVASMLTRFQRCVAVMREDDDPRGVCGVSSDASSRRGRETEAPPCAKAGGTLRRSGGLTGHG